MPARILIVDDDAVVRRVLRKLLERPEVTAFSEAEDGQQGLDIFREWRPDLAIVDMNMPKLNGLEAASAMNALSPKTPIVLFTIHYTPQLTAVAQEHGISEVVSKHEFARILQIVDKLLAPELPADHA
jgi:CheY-like chemotaxis protein